MTIITSGGHSAINASLRWLLLRSKDFLSGPDLCLSMEEFQLLVRQLIASVDFLPWLWRKAESNFVILAKLCKVFTHPSLCASFHTVLQVTAHLMTSS